MNNRVKKNPRNNSNKIHFISVYSILSKKASNICGVVLVRVSFYFFWKKKEFIYLLIVYVCAWNGVSRFMMNNSLTGWLLYNSINSIHTMFNMPFWIVQQRINWKYIYMCCVCLIFLYLNSLSLSLF